MTESATQELSTAEGPAQRLRIDATWMRGGTSKCWIFHADRLPTAPRERDAVIIRLFGSPDLRQIDGVGGGSSTTSKAMVIDAAHAHDGVLEYEVGQVSVNTARVEWESNCGNCASAVALYAVQEGLVPLTSPTTTLTLVNKRSGLILEAILDTPDADRPPQNGDETVPGTAFPGVRVVLRWSPPSWSEFGATLPTGHPVDLIEVDGKRVWGTLIDAGSPAALVKASDLGIEGTPPDRDEVEALLPWLMKFRVAAAQLMNLRGDNLQSIPKVGIVGQTAEGAGTDVEARMASMTELHPAIGITSAVAVAAASAIEGTTVNDVTRLVRPASEGQCEFSIGTFAGPVKVEIQRAAEGEALTIDSVRSARRLADATLHLGSDWNGSTRQP